MTIDCPLSECFAIALADTVILVGTVLVICRGQENLPRAGIFLIKARQQLDNVLQGRDHSQLFELGIMIWRRRNPGEKSPKVRF